MNHRKLRIAWSTACILACILPVFVWLRGYSSSAIPTVWHGHTFRLESGKLLIDETIHSVPQPIADANYELGDGTGRWGVTRTTTVTMPRHVLPAALAIPFLGVAATLPWLPWSNRFSLRTLLVITTLVAALFGVIAWLR